MNATAQTPKFGPLNGRWANVPPFRGKERLIHGAAAIVRGMGSAERSVCLWPAAPFHVNLRDRIQRLMWAASYESHVTKALCAVLRPGDVFVDVGAHIGYHSYFAAGITGASGSVVSFEADPGVFARLRENLASFSYAHPFHCAVWEEERTLTFARSSNAGESGWGKLTTVQSRDTGEHIPINAVSLDAWYSRSSCASIRAIKIDAEGSEPAVLRGAVGILQKLRPVLFFEMNAPLLQESDCAGNELRNRLLQEGYAIYRLSFLQLEALASLAHCEFMDCLAIPGEQAEGLLRLLQQAGFRV